MADWDVLFNSLTSYPMQRNLNCTFFVVDEMEFQQIGKKVGKLSKAVLKVGSIRQRMDSSNPTNDW